MATLDIKTTQHVHIKYPAAGISDRIGAFVVDLFIIGVYAIVTTSLLTEMLGGNDLWIIMLAVIIPVSLYHLLMEVMLGGQSIGKKAVQIKVLKLDGSAAGPGSYFIRWIFRPFEITATSGTAAFFTILFNGRGQRLGDIAAGTIVVKVKKKTTLSDTLYADISEGYKPGYPQVTVLDDEDISVIREVLAAGDKYEKAVHLKMLLKVRKAIEKKTGITVLNDIDSITFLQTVIKDYNAIHG